MKPLFLFVDNGNTPDSYMEIQVLMILLKNMISFIDQEKNY
jgi:hypothetical protein